MAVGQEHSLTVRFSPYHTMTPTSCLSRTLPARQGERLDDATGIALQRDLRGRGPVFTVSRQIEPYNLVTGVL